MVMIIVMLLLIARRNSTDSGNRASSGRRMIIKMQRLDGKMGLLTDRDDIRWWIQSQRFLAANCFLWTGQLRFPCCVWAKLQSARWLTSDRSRHMVSNLDLKKNSGPENDICKV